MGDFKWDIWTYKLLKGLGLVFIVYGGLYTADYIVDNPLPPEYVFWSGLIVIGLQQLANYIKHNYFIK